MVDSFKNIEIEINRICWCLSFLIFVKRKFN